MKPLLFVLALCVPLANAAAEPSLQKMVGDASTCSDASLRDFASQTCESPEKIAAMAVAKCQSKWDAAADLAIGTLPPGASSDKARAHGRSLTTYLDAMVYEYIRVAELKAIDMRTAAGRCGFD